MILSFLTVAKRMLLKNKQYSILNIAGLSIGLACFILIALWIKNEICFDRFHSKAERIYRVASTMREEHGLFDQAITCIPLAPAMLNDLPAIENAVRISKSGSVVQYGEKKFNEDDLLGVDPSFLDIFDFKLLQGDPVTALRDPYSIVLSKSMAKKYFGEKNPIGELLTVFQNDPDGNGAQFKITGIIEDCVSLSHFQYNFLFSFSTFQVTNPRLFSNEGWSKNGCYTYVLLKSGSSVQNTSTSFQSAFKVYSGYTKKDEATYCTYFLQPLTDIRLRSNIRNEIESTGNITYVKLFGSVGLIVLLLASINYINLSTAQAFGRFREVGVRKALGARKSQLIAQHLLESWLLAMIAVVISFLWIELVRSLFERQIGFPITDLYSLSTLTLVFVLATLVGIISGLYPSMFVSSYKTRDILNGESRGSASGWLRRGLLVLQFSVTIVLIAGILTMHQQLKYIKSKDLGFRSENLLLLNVNGSKEVVAGFAPFSQALMSTNVAKSVARSNTSLGSRLDNALVTLPDVSGKKVTGAIHIYEIDTDYISTYNMSLLAGRGFTNSNDTLACLVNEATMRAYGFRNPADLVGQEIEINGIKNRVAGVVKDFHYNSFQYKIDPVCMHLLTAGRFSRITVKFDGNVNQVIDKVSSLWKTHFPESVLEFSLADERIENQYQTERRLSEIFYALTLISLVMACLGLFALVSFSLKLRTKEIGIRKVLGASVTRIAGMVSGEFLGLVVISGFVASPISYFLIKQWLNRFAYHATVGVGVVLVSVSATLVVAALTISVRTIRSAKINPVQSLRSE